MNSTFSLDDAIRKVPDFPKPGILFYDITGILVNPEAFRYCIDRMIELYKDARIDAIAAIESRGFVFAAPFAERMGIPLILIRKKGKLPGKTFSCKYALEYGTAEIEVHQADVKPGERILVMDDLIATGGTLNAAKSVLEQGGATVTGFFGVVGLPFLNYSKVLGDTPVQTLVEYDGE
ncbi:MAG TPA: adenine phosphoribosyltransferase [Treponemataceae bacterium]|jgi:adenine phosphoribosyltransferase|nr:MAG: Adenine phosphoribosyltransferase [Spirochaetes bacterium ADurb.Bin269]TAH45741.1 MAG: adenine phosphoribosyltransferase [Treponema sp.]HOC28659.1 adenine phosphoribosyltransferase [Treponemataceae bacterium]HPX48527.1 adenine phosphoribosyltransferase [Treponemataceae bacterium]HQL31825.1 adenine phosphoribosyltransferase [Treponemataceae bacterium]